MNSSLFWNSFGEELNPLVCTQLISITENQDYLCQCDFTIDIKSFLFPQEYKKKSIENLTVSL